MEGMRSFGVVLCKRLRKFNVYTEAHEDSPQKRRDQILSTRIYIILLVISLSALVEYTALNWQLIHVEVHNPSLITYEGLYAKYARTLNCPCMRAAFDIGKFASIAVSFHQVSNSIVSSY